MASKAQQCEVVTFLGHKIPVEFEGITGRSKQLVVFNDRHWRPPARRWVAVTSGALYDLIASGTGATPQAAAKRLEAKCHAQFRRVGAALGYEVD